MATLQLRAVADVLGEFVADRLALFRVGLADEIIGGHKSRDVGHDLRGPKR